MVRRARRRLAMVAAAAAAEEETKGKVDEDGEVDGEEEEEDEELLGKIYFLKTRLSGRRLLGAWSALQQQPQQRQQDEAPLDLT